MKKIKIVTFHRAHNYGALLQAYALQNFFLENGYQTEFIDYRCQMIENPYKIKYYKGINLKNFLKLTIKKTFFNNKLKRRFSNFNKFIDSEFLITKKCFSKSDVEKIIDDKDILITGSDQVWNPKLTGCLDEIYTLNFKTNNLKISYAASIGNLEVIEQMKDEFITKLDNLDFISVREKSAKEELEKILKKSVNVTLDPTLLIKNDFWMKKRTENCEKEKYIFCYMVQKDEEFIKISNYISEVTGLKIIHSNLKNPGFRNVYKSIYECDPIDFINYINNAEYVITTSFHATVFSIIFHKKFYVVPHRKTGARVTNLLNALDINGRNIDNINEFKNVENIDSEIIWSEVEKKLENERKKSSDWILNAIRMRDNNE